MIYFLVFIVGLLFGSFLTACIYRIPRHISLLNPRRSFCPECRHPISWRRNIPLLSFILLKGKCYYCSEKISYLYPVVELSTGIITVLLYYHFGLTKALLIYLILFYGLLAISVIDLQHRMIPNKILGIILASGIVLNLILQVIPWQQTVVGFVVSGLLVLLIRVIGQQMLKKESMGMGDVKLAAVIGFFIGWKLFLAALFIGSGSALLFILAMKWIDSQFHEQQIPFAPFLSLGAFISLLWGSNLWQWHLTIVG